MFKFCCEAPIDQPSVTIAEIDHTNPIQRRLNPNKVSRKQQKHLGSSNLTNGKAKSIIHCSDTYKSNYNQSLAKSIIMPVCNDQSRGRTIHTWNSVQKDGISKQTFSQFNQSKYSSRLQQKYINLLEQNNKYLELTLSQYQPKEKTEKNFTAELLVLKERLKNIDFSVINKLSGSSSVTEKQKLSQTRAFKHF